MKKIIWIGGPFFSNMLSRFGWESVYIHTFSDFHLFTYEELVSLAGFEPDVVVVADKSLPPFVMGIESFPCLTVFYCIDSHLHGWYPYYAQAFDLCLLSLYDHIPVFARGNLTKDRILWTPPYAQDAYRPKEKFSKEWDCIFVGTVSDNTPLRKMFLEELGKILPSLHVTRGNFLPLFPKARVVINFCEHGDLNFRVFESMGLGCALVTPRIGNRQDFLFTDGKEYLLYDDLSAKNAKDAIERLLNDPVMREKIEKNALACIDQNHRASHRARDFTNFIARFWPQHTQIITNRKNKAKSIHDNFLRILYLLWAKEIQNTEIQKEYLYFSKWHKNGRM